MGCSRMYTPEYDVSSCDPPSLELVFGEYIACTAQNLMLSSATVSGMG